MDPEAVAREVLAAFDGRRQRAPFTDGDPSFELVQAGAASVALMRLQEARGDRVIGHKLGFTNRTIWDEYGVHAPIWGPIYAGTVREGATFLDLSPLLEPRIEPEIVFRLSGPPQAGMEPEALIACVSHVALGFEVVQSAFPGWRFRAPDTVAAAALHGRLVVGPWVEVRPEDGRRWVTMLADFPVTLLKDGEVADEGRSSNVLGGGPVAALAHLAEALADLPAAPRATAGHLFTTGTLTRALPVSPGESWEARLDGVPLGPMRIVF